MDILGGIDYEFPPHQFFRTDSDTNEKPLFTTGTAKIHKKKPLFTSQATDYAGGDMLDPTLTTSSDLSSPWLGAAVMGTAGLLAILVIAYKRLCKSKTHLHVDTDEPLLGRA